MKTVFSLFVFIGILYFSSTDGSPTTADFDIPIIEVSSSSLSKSSPLLSSSDSYVTSNSDSVETPAEDFNKSVINRNLFLKKMGYSNVGFMPFVPMNMGMPYLPTLYQPMPYQHMYARQPSMYNGGVSCCSSYPVRYSNCGIC